MARPFADVLRDLAGGQSYETLTSALSEVVEAVMLTRKTGELTLKLKIAPNGENSVRIADEIKLKVPEENRGASIFYVASGGILTRNNPLQPDLPLREVAGTMKEAANA
jgi:hypothetical protein